MKTNIKFLKVTLSMLVMVSFLFVSTSCGGDDPPVAQVDHFEVMTDYMKSNSMDLPAMTTDWIITATAVEPNLSDYYITLNPQVFS